MSTSTTAAKADATKTPVSFSWGGEEWQVLPPSAWPIAALEAFEDERVVAFLRAIIGPDDFARLKSGGRTVADFTDFVRATQEALGLGN